MNPAFSRVDRAASAVNFGFHHNPPRKLVRIRPQFEHLGLQQDHFEERIESDFFLRRHFCINGLAAPHLWDQPSLGQGVFDPIWVRAGQVDLIDGHDNRHVRRFRMVHSFNRLRHHTIICGDHQHDDIRDLRTAGSHRCERFMPGGVQKRDRLPACFDYVGADVLRDAARLSLGHFGFPDRIQ